MPRFFPPSLKLLQKVTSGDKFVLAIQKSRPLNTPRQGSSISSHPNTSLTDISFVRSFCFKKTKLNSLEICKYPSSLGTGILKYRSVRCLTLPIRLFLGVSELWKSSKHLKHFPPFLLPVLRTRQLSSLMVI